MGIYTSAVAGAGGWCCAVGKPHIEGKGRACWTRAADCRVGSRRHRRRRRRPTQALVVQATVAVFARAASGINTTKAANPSVFDRTAPRRHHHVAPPPPPLIRYACTGARGCVCVCP